MNKTPFAVGLAMIMGISAVFAVDRVKPLEEIPQQTLEVEVQAAEPEVAIQAAEVGNAIVPIPAIEANIVMEEAPLILESAQGQYATDRPNAEEVQGMDDNRSLKFALAELQQALEALKNEAELTRHAVAQLEQQ